MIPGTIYSFQAFVWGGVKGALNGFTRLVRRGVLFVATTYVLTLAIDACRLNKHAL